ncbi:hypothetical protein KUV80_15725 [Fictibacillus nanhaiensis]|uniref:hypothetical protein n=1 Tax=Fictibacillus nanhaiensis TaxID=742169 RepID=UPI001C944DE6|nr:hypothetical protein [Fictibacillus nanhaiensis]MBY6038108.1 hypothetical protein [Fictibacillus nanhaiensis]
MITNTAFISSYEKGNHYAFGRNKSEHVKKVQHLEAITNKKPEKDTKKEDTYEKKNAGDHVSFKTYSKGDVEKYHKAAKEAVRIYSNWRKDLAEEAADFIATATEDIMESKAPLDDLMKQKVFGSLDKFISENEEKLEVLLERLPKGQIKKRLTSAQELLGTIRELIYHQMEKVMKDHTSLNPIDNDNVGQDSGINAPIGGNNPPIMSTPLQNTVGALLPNQVFSSGTFKMDIKVGTLTSELMFIDPKQKSGAPPMFYVVDGYGNRKAVDIKFSNESVQKLFDERLKSSKLFKKDISLEQFNRVIKKIESYMKELASIDPERLKSKVHGEKENVKLNKIIDDITELFYSIRS